MAITRRAVLEQLATVTDADQRETTSPEALAAGLGTDVATVETHLSNLAACELVHMDADGRARVTVTGEQLLSLDTDQLVIIAPDVDQPDE